MGQGGKPAAPALSGDDVPPQPAERRRAHRYRRRHSGSGQAPPQQLRPAGAGHDSSRRTFGRAASNNPRQIARDSATVPQGRTDLQPPRSPRRPCPPNLRGAPVTDRKHIVCRMDRSGRVDHQPTRQPCPGSRARCAPNADECVGPDLRTHPVRTVEITGHSAPQTQIVNPLRSFINCRTTASMDIGAPGASMHRMVKMSLGWSPTTSELSHQPWTFSASADDISGTHKTDTPKAGAISAGTQSIDG